MVVIVSSLTNQIVVIFMHTINANKAYIKSLLLSISTYFESKCGEFST